MSKRYRVGFENSNDCSHGTCHAVPTTSDMAICGRKTANYWWDCDSTTSEKESESICNRSMIKQVMALSIDHPRQPSCQYCRNLLGIK